MTQTQQQRWGEEMRNLLRGATRAMIFAIALFYTMEVWWIGTYLGYWRLFALFFGAMLIDVYMMPVTSKDGEQLSLRRVVTATVRNSGMALLASTIIVVVLGRVSVFQQPVERDIATIVLLSVPIAIGSSIAQILEVYAGVGGQSSSSGGGGQDEKTKDSGQKNPWLFVLKDIGSTTGGALFVAFPLAPTMEIPLLAARLNYWQELAVIALTLLVSYMMAYSTGITRKPPSGPHSKGAKVWPAADTLMSYAVSLLVALVTLYLFGRFTLDAPLAHILSLVAVLGLPAAVGGAAGRMAL